MRDKGMTEAFRVAKKRRKAIERLPLYPIEHARG